MELNKIILSLFLLALSLQVWAQSRITMRYHIMHTDVTISNAGFEHKVLGMVDTGASVCMIDSTFAIDSCHIKNLKGDKIIGNTSGKDIKASSYYLDSLTIGGVVYTKVWCFVIDLVGKLQQYAPKFIIGGDILKRDLWLFDFNENQLKRIFTIPNNVVATIRWKDYADAALNHIYFKGKIEGKNTRILFDTGSARNELNSDFKVTPNDTIKKMNANIAEKLTYNNIAGLCNNISVEISKYHFKGDFIKPKEHGAKYPRINSDFLQGKRWVLDYKHRSLYILSSD